MCSQRDKIPVRPPNGGDFAGVCLGVSVAICARQVQDRLGQMVGTGRSAAGPWIHIATVHTKTMSLEHDAEAAESATEEPMADTSVDTGTETESVETEEPAFSGLNRRGMLLSGGILGLLGLGVGTASADASGQVGTANDPLKQLYTDALNGSTLPGFSDASQGQILTFDANSDLTLGEVTTDQLTINEDAEDATAIISPAFKAEPTTRQDGANERIGSPNIIGNPDDNNPDDNVTNGKQGVFIGGGGEPASGPYEGNSVTGSFGAIVGGRGNKATNDAVTCGGFANGAIGNNSFVGGGSSNTAEGKKSMVLGGQGCTAGGEYSFAAGRFMEIEGNGSFGFADSQNTSVNRTNNDEVYFRCQGGFVIDSNGSDGDAQTIEITGGLPTSGTNQKSVEITNSGQLVATSSSARYKTNIDSILPATSGVLDLQPKSYEYKETGQADTGLIAEEVDEALPEIVNYDDEGRPDAVRYDRVGMFLAPEVSENRDRLETVEAAREECEETIETLEVELDAKDARLADQADRIEHLESTVENKSILLEGVQSVVDEKEARIDELEAENTKLETRLSAVEAELGFGGVTADASVADD